MYPDNVDKFIEKLNKKQKGVYVIEEVLPILNGVYEGFLAHDNVNEKTIAIYTGSKLTGEKIQTYILETPSETPWKLYIKVFAKVEKVYLTYETQGDTVEAEDINRVQSSIVAIETELERHKEDLQCHIEAREVDGGSFV